jgi:hypothetical protein
MVVVCQLLVDRWKRFWRLSSNRPNGLLRKWNRQLTAAVFCGACTCRFGARPLFQQAANAARGRGVVLCEMTLALTLCMGLCGCVERRMTVRSNPPGAILYVDNYEIGPTPISTGFTYYGTREFKLVKDGYETLTVKQEIPPPWYEIFPADFVAENFVPGQIRDQRMLDFQMKPQMVVPTDQLIARAEGLRRSAHGIPGISSETVSPIAPGTTPVPSTSPAGQPFFQQPTNSDMIPAANGLGGQPLHPLPNGR